MHSNSLLIIKKNNYQTYLIVCKKILSYKKNKKISLLIKYIILLKNIFNIYYKLIRILYH